MLVYFFLQKNKIKIKKRKEIKKRYRKKKGGVCIGVLNFWPTTPVPLFFFLFFFPFILYNFKMTLTEKLPEFVGNELFVTHTNHITTMSNL